MISLQDESEVLARDKSSWPCSMLVFESDEVKESSSAWLGRQPAVLTGVLYCTVLYCTDSCTDREPWPLHWPGCNTHHYHRR